MTFVNDKIFHVQAAWFLLSVPEVDATLQKPMRLALDQWLGMASPSITVSY